MTAADRWIDRFLRQLRRGQFLHRAADWLAVFLFLFGTVVLATKLLLPGLWPAMLWLGAAAVPVALGAWVHSRRQPYTRSESVAMIDRKLGLGGLLMTLSETPDERWSEKLPQIDGVWRESLPRLRPVRFARMLALPALFAVGACLVPLREANTAPTLRTTVGQQATHQLEELLQSLDEAAVLDEEEKEQLQDEIQKLAEETRTTPLTHEKWETVDALRDRLQLRVDESAATLAKASEAAGALAAASDETGSELSLEQVSRLEKDVAGLLQKLEQRGAFNGLSPEMRAQLQRLTKNGELRLPADQAARQQALDQLQKMLDKESRRLSELRKQCQACQGGACEKCGECHGEGLCQGLQNGNRPGRGGVTRGRGDAPLTWGDESDEQGTKFKETVLPPGYFDDPKHQIERITRSAPEVDPAATAPRNPLRDADAASGSETWDRTLRPRHRSVVRRYFDSE